MSSAAALSGDEIRGFSRLAMAGFVGENGGFLRRDEPLAVRFGFTVADRHCNPAGTCHGGWLATMADLQLLFEGCREAGLTPADLVTVSLSVDYLAAARKGEWVESSARVVRRARALLFVEGQAIGGDRPVLRMNGIYQIRQG